MTTDKELQLASDYAFITLCGYDHQEYGLEVHDAKVKLADSLSSMPHIIKWFDEYFKSEQL